MNSLAIFKENVREMDNRARQLREASVVASRALLEVLRERPEGDRRISLARGINICGPEGDWHDTITGVEIGQDGNLYIVTENAAEEEELADQEPAVIHQICSDLNKHL